MAPGVGGAGQPAPSPAHTGGGGGHRGVQRSISATSSNKPRRGSTGADNTCELMSGAGGGTVGGDGEGGQGRSWLIDVSTGPGSLGGIFSFSVVSFYQRGSTIAIGEYCGGCVVFMFQFSQFIGCSQFGKGSSNCLTTFGGLYFKGGELSTFRFSFMLGAKSYA
jgi:hypothetical protein